jgi:DNA end-binding protein Ku
MRAFWQGYLKLALVSCPIGLYPATSTTERVSFRQINKVTGNRLRQQLVDDETHGPVAPEHKGRGYEVGKGQYLIVEDDELDAIEIESTHTIEIDRFVPRSGIDQRFFDTPYYVAPNEPVGQEAFAVIREAMRSKAMVALGRLVLSKRERVIALEPYDKGLLGTTLRYPYEVRAAADYFGDLPDLAVAPDMVTLAGHILDRKAGDFEPASFRDRYEEALLAHLKAKGRSGARTKAAACSAAPGDQPHGGAAPEHRRGQEAGGCGAQGHPGPRPGVRAAHDNGGQHERTCQQARALRHLCAQIERA